MTRALEEQIDQLTHPLMRRGLRIIFTTPPPLAISGFVQLSQCCVIQALALRSYRWSEDVLGSDTATNRCSNRQHTAPRSWGARKLLTQHQRPQAHLDIVSVQSRDFNESTAILASESSSPRTIDFPLQRLEIALVPNKHDRHLLTGVVPQLAQPQLYVFEGSLAANIEHHDSTGDVEVTAWSRSSVAFKACGVAYTDCDGFAMGFDVMSRDLNPDCRFAVGVEFVAGES